MSSFPFLSRTLSLTGTVIVVAVGRKVLKDLTLSDGTTIPRGTTVGVANLALQTDEVSRFLSSSFCIEILIPVPACQTHFPDADKFIGFRFADKRDSEKEENIKHQMVTPTADFFLFGYGRHAW